MADTKAFDIDAFISGARRPERTGVIYARPDLIADIESIEAEIAATTDDRMQVPLRKRLDRLRTELLESRHTFRLRGTSEEEERAIFAALPIPDDADDATAALILHTRMAHLIAKQCVDPKMTPEQVDALWTAIGEAEFRPLAQASRRCREESAAEAPFWRASYGSGQTS